MMEDEKEEKVESLEVVPTGVITLRSADEKVFVIEKKNAFISKLVSQALESG